MFKICALRQITNREYTHILADKSLETRSSDLKINMFINNNNIYNLYCS